MVSLKRRRIIEYIIDGIGRVCSCNLCKCVLVRTRQRGTEEGLQKRKVEIDTHLGRRLWMRTRDVDFHARATFVVLFGGDGL